LAGLKAGELSRPKPDDNNDDGRVECRGVLRSTEEYGGVQGSTEPIGGT